MSVEIKPETLPDARTPAVDRVAPGQRRWTAGSVIAAIGINGILIIIAFLAVFPLYWALSTSFLPAAEINGGAQRLFVHDPTLSNYRDLFSKTRFLGAIGNSAVISVIVTVGGTLFAAAAGYAFGKLRFRGRNLLFLLVLITMMVPPLVTVPINFVLMSKLGLINTMWAVVLPQLTPAFGIFWMRQYVISAVPDQVLEAARVDGCGEFRVFVRIVLPILRPALAGLAIYMFMASWNQLLLPLTYLQDNSKQTYPVFLNTLNSSYAIPQTNLAVAASVLATIPLALMFIFGQRHFVAGVTSGAVKE